MQWNEAISHIRHVVFKVSVGDFEGTSFIVGTTGKSLLFATAWHVIRDLYSSADKHQRYVELQSASGDFEIKANVVGLARFGRDELDVGLFWVGPAFTSENVDDILNAFANSPIKDGIIDLSGGGNVISATGTRENAVSEREYNILVRQEVVQGSKVGWLGYPSVDDQTLCFFSGVISSTSSAGNMYLVDGTVLTGLSGGPVFNYSGDIIGIVSKYVGEEDTDSGLVQVTPVADLRAIV